MDLPQMDDQRDDTYNVNLRDKWPDATVRAIGSGLRELGEQGRLKSGGPYRLTGTTWLGDKGREVFVPEVAGRILPHAKSMALAAGDADEQPVERAVKFVGPDTIEGLAMPFASFDTDGETFTKNTDFCFDWFGKSGRPFLFEHGLDSSLKTDRIGTQTDYDVREEGIWATVQLDRNRRYRKAVDELIERKAFGYSSGAMQHLAKKNSRQEITRWPWVELSGTPIPSHPDTLGIHYVKSADFLDRLEDDAPPALKAALAALDEWAANSDDDNLPDGMKFADLVDRLSVDGPAWVKARRDWYAKSGRVLSATTRERLLRHPASLRELASDLEDLLTEADAPKAGKSDLWAEAIQAEMTAARLLGVSFDSGDPIQ